MNFEVLTLVNHVSNKITPESIGLSARKLSLYRNYFIQKSVAAINVENGCNALNALKLFSEDVVLGSTNHNIYLSNGNTKLIYNLKNSFGVQAVIKSVSNAIITPLGNPSQKIDVTKVSTFKMNQIGVELGA